MGNNLLTHTEFEIASLCKEPCKDDAIGKLITEGTGTEDSCMLFSGDGCELNMSFKPEIKISIVMLL